jgi:anti-sigma regulatory factor (Ser/Thr protein kinase)
MTTAAARALGFADKDIGNLALVVTEAATNLVKHAVGGQLLWRALERDHGVGLEILALDRGPGITNVGECLRNGYSTAGSPGTGLGAIARLATEFDIYSLPGKGTALLARLWSGRLSVPGPVPALELGVVCLAKPGEQVCGDGWTQVVQADRQVLLVADGLGHGPDAATAAQAAVQVLREHPALAPAALIEAAHAVLRSTRGAALAVAELNPGQQAVRFAGVGNIAGVVFNAGSSRHLVSHNGTVGHTLRKVQEFSVPWPPGALLILHSDGLATHWNLTAYPGLLGRDPSLIAGVLYRDYTRGHDDVTVLILKQRY